MAKKAIIIIPIVVIISLILVMMIKFNDGYATMEEALSPSNPQSINILHEEKMDDGIVVFYNHSGWGDFSRATVKKSTVGRFKILYSGVSGDIQRVLDKRGISYSYWPAIENASPPLYCGVIDSSIKQVKIVEGKRNYEREAKIIEVNDFRIWLVYMDQFQGSKFNIIGISGDGKEVISIEDSISPRYIEEKPLKGYE
ncbi:hypothetical protein SAMN02745751_02976 [Dethiosulfatibacter aminovorans DSM 17477]|uniref:Uncharacterized protein n=1 Tax=Dethiosulfatibacter aminovorans DSM 17477 TaxID=1121476 RepID=A0A1M6KTM1_9FIRM|nr:hypothetical protein [Dethiosulfatibacter aminovorans]SHJ62204.1 hypothetical protein SAMN02745751_02976 [Dethiosulfatibacter aminovorans DSM 17477]